MATATSSSYKFTFSYVDREQCLAIGVALPVICFLIVLLRFFTRSIQKLRVGSDDWLIVAGLLAVIGMGACFIYGEREGVMGLPTPTPPSNLTTADEILYYVDPTTVLLEKIEFAYQILMMIAYGSIKLSIIFFYRRIFVPQRGTVFDIVCTVTIVVVFLWTLAFILMIIFPCGALLWPNWGSTGDQLALCPIIFTSEYGLVVSDLILDFWVILLPLPLIWRLHLSPQRKLAVSGIMLLGASAVGASITRLVLYVQELNGFIAGIDIDTNLSVTLGLWWSLLEVGLALIASCLPTLSYLFTHFSPRKAINSIQSLLPLHSTRGSSKDVKSTYSADNEFKKLPDSGASISLVELRTTSI